MDMYENIGGAPVAVVHAEAGSLNNQKYVLGKLGVSRRRSTTMAAMGCFGIARSLGCISYSFRQTPRDGEGPLRPRGSEKRRGQARTLRAIIKRICAGSLARWALNHENSLRSGE